MLSKSNKAQYIITEIFLTQSFFVGEGYSRIFEITGTDSWIAMVLGILIGILIIYCFHLVSKNTNYNLIRYLTSHKYLGLVIAPLLLIYYTILFIYPILMIESLIHSYYLTYTNVFVIIIPFVLITFYTSLKGIKAIMKMTTFIFPILIPIMLFGYIGLGTLINSNNYLPLLTSTNHNIFTSALLFAIFSSSTFFLLSDYKASFNIKLAGYLIGSLLSICITTLITGVLGKFYMQLYSFPVYMAYKKINILSFLQNLENILYIPGYFHTITLCSISLNRIANLQKSSTKKTIPIIICVLSIIIIGVDLGIDYSKYIWISKNIPYIMLIFIIILGPGLYIVSQIKKTRSI